MTGIVFANYGNWSASLAAFAAFAFVLYMLGTAGYRVTAKGRARHIEVHSMLGLRRVDLTSGFTVRQGWFGPSIVVVRVGRRRCRLNGGLGRRAAIDDWLRTAASA